MARKIASRTDIENRLKNSNGQLAQAEADQSAATFASIDYEEAHMRRMFFMGEIGALEWTLGIEVTRAKPKFTGRHQRVLSAGG
jgi:hypothetical protein